MIIVVPIIVSVPVAVRAPFVTARIIPAAGVTPAALPYRIQFRPGIVCLATVPAMFVDLMTIMFLGLFHAILAKGMVVGRGFHRQCDQKLRGYSEGGGAAQKFSSLHLQFLRKQKFEQWHLQITRARSRLLFPG